MIAFIGRGYGATTSTWLDEYDSDTATYAISGNDGPWWWYENPSKHANNCPFLAVDMPWLFDFDEPWKSPNHYPAAPINLKPSKQVPRITNHIIKQPGPMRRGNRI